MGKEMKNLKIELTDFRGFHGTQGGAIAIENNKDDRES